MSKNLVRHKGTMFRKIVILCFGIIICISLSEYSFASEYYPNYVGNYWILESADGIQKHRISIVKKIPFSNRSVNLLHRETKDGTDKFYIATSPDGEIKLYWSKMFTGFLGNLVFEYNPPETFIPADLRVGRTWIIRGQTEGIEVYMTSTVVKREAVTVPAGTFNDCLKIQQDFLIKTFLPVNVRGFIWLAKDIGIVKEKNTAGEVFELVKYKLFWPWDINRDQKVDVFDLVMVGKHFGESVIGEPHNPDVNGDGIVNIFDLVLVGKHFGEKAAQ